MADFSVGEDVRVTLSGGKRSRATVSCVHERTKGGNAAEVAYDVILVSDDGDESSEQTMAEVTGLASDDVTPLENFECDGTLDTPPPGSPKEAADFAEHLKGFAKVLFNLGDYGAAEGVYKTALRAVEPRPQVGASVMVAVHVTDVTTHRFGMLSDVDTASSCCDVIYDQPGGDEELEEEEEEEEGVQYGRVTVISPMQKLQCVLCLNLGRCALKATRPSQAVSRFTEVMSLMRHHLGNRDFPLEVRKELRSLWCTAVYLRGKSHLAQDHIKLARRDAASAAKAAADAAGKASCSKLEQEVEKRAKCLLKTNRQLARDVTQWVDVTMKRHEQAVQTQAGQSTGSHRALIATGTVTPGTGTPGPACRRTNAGSDRESSEEEHDDDGSHRRSARDATSSSPSGAPQGHRGGGETAKSWWGLGRFSPW